MKKTLTVVALCAMAGAIASPLSRAVPRPQEQNQEADGQREKAEWKSWGGNLHNTRSSLTEHKITPENAGSLKTKWVFTTKGDVSATPTVEGNAVYAVDWGGGVFRINAETGKAVWSKTMPGYTGNSASFSRTSPAIDGDKLIIGDQASGTIFAISKKNGDLIWKRVVDPLPAAFITNSAVISEGVAYIGVSSGEEGIAATDPTYVFKFRASIQALDVNTGAVLWKTYMVPEGYTGGSVWGSNFVIDHRRGLLYSSTGNNYSVPKEVSTCLKAAKTLAEQLACLSPKDYIDSVVALSLEDGTVKWDRRLEGADTWHEGCIVSGGVPCPDPSGPDYDLGAGTNLITVKTKDAKDSDDWTTHQVLGAGQKSGVYWGLNPDTGKVIYGTQVGPGGIYGGVEWGAATDNVRVYVPITDYPHTEYTLKPTGEKWNGGSWSGLDPLTGKILWQTKVPGQDPKHPSLPAGALAPVSAANGVVFGGALSGYMVAMDGKSGKILWRFQSGGSVNCGPAIVDGVVYWGSGYRNDPERLGGKGNNKLYAFTVPDGDHDRNHENGDDR